MVENEKTVAQKTLVYSTERHIYSQVGGHPSTLCIVYTCCFKNIYIDVKMADLTLITINI